MSPSQSRTGAQLLVECLLAQDVETGFGVPGESYLAVLDALHDVSNSFRFINCRNEGGAAFMAEGYGKLTGKPGVCFVTRGPGATNASIGIHTAKQNSTPMVVFVGQIDNRMRDREAFQELDYRAVFGAMAKWVVEIDTADRVPELVSRAFAMARSGRPGPVVVALPENMLVEPSTALPRGHVVSYQASMNDHDASAVFDALKGAKRPVVMVGEGGWNDEGRSAIQRFAEANQLPVVVGFRGQDILDNGSPSYVGDAGVGMPPHIRGLLKASDVILAINIRFGEIETDSYTLFDPAHFDQKLVQIHPDPDEIGKVLTPDIAIVSGPNSAAAVLAKADAVDNPVWSAVTENARKDWLANFDTPAQPGALDMGKVMEHLRSVLPHDTIIANGAGNFATWPGRFLKYGPHMRVIAPQSGTMGTGLPAAVMAKIMEPSRFVLCFAGDGDFQMNCQELGTAQQYGAAPVILVLNNGMYGTIRAHQEREYPGRVSATDLVNPDFATLARAYGMHGERVEATEDFAAAFARACESPTGAVLDLVIDPEGLAPRATISSVRAAATG